MNIKNKKFIQNFSYTLIANLLSVVISTVLILIVPKFVSVENYGYWQLYIFYSSYISYMSLGLTDGVYLRYGGYEYKNLHKPVFVSQYWFLVTFNVVVNSSIAFVYGINSTDPNKSIVVLLTCLTGILVVPRSLLTFTLQSTNRIKEYSIIIILERIVYFALVLLFLLFGINKFEYLIFADILGKVSSVIYACSISKDLVFGKFESIKNSIREIGINISVGSKLLIANFASLLIIGIVRFSIENNWSVETFGKVSLTLSISNMLMLFINAVGLILYPALRRTAEDKLPDIYRLMRTIIMVPLIGVLIFYYPAKVLLSSWLPQYTDSFIYMALLFPMCIFESKTLMLINTYLKTLRKEKMLLIINLSTVVLSLGLAYINVFLLNNLNLSVLSITLLLAVRSIFAEIYLSKVLHIKVKSDILLEVSMTLVFIIVSWYLELRIALIVYFIAYILYLVLKKSDITYFMKNASTILNSKK